MLRYTPEYKKDWLFTKYEIASKVSASKMSKIWVPVISFERNKSGVEGSETRLMCNDRNIVRAIRLTKSKTIDVSPDMIQNEHVFT